MSDKKGKKVAVAPFKAPATVDDAAACCRVG
jgi:hypothetical protein